MLKYDVDEKRNQNTDNEKLNQFFFIYRQYSVVVW